MKVCATSNCPSRSRCIAIARLIRDGCEARASYSVGKFLTGSVWDVLALVPLLGRMILPYLMLFDTYYANHISFSYLH